MRDQRSLTLVADRLVVGIYLAEITPTVFIYNFSFGKKRLLPCKGRSKQLIIGLISFHC